MIVCWISEYLIRNRSVNTILVEETREEETEFFLVKVLVVVVVEFVEVLVQLFFQGFSVPVQGSQASQSI